MKILIDKDGTCGCTCANHCALSRIGTSKRCTAEELKEEGYEVVKLRFKFLKNIILKEI